MNHSIHLLLMRIKFAKRRGTNVVKQIHQFRQVRIVRNLGKPSMRTISERNRKKLEKDSVHNKHQPLQSAQKPAVQASALNATTDSQTVQQVSRADRLAELRRQSQESVKKTESILEPEVPTSEPEPQIKSKLSCETEQKKSMEIVTPRGRLLKHVLKRRVKRRTSSNKSLPRRPKNGNIDVVENPNTMMLVVDGSQKSRNSIVRDTTITNMQHVISSKMIESQMNIGPTY